VQVLAVRPVDEQVDAVEQLTAPRSQPALEQLASVAAVDRDRPLPLGAEVIDQGSEGGCLLERFAAADRELRDREPLEPGRDRLDPRLDPRLTRPRRRRHAAAACERAVLHPDDGAGSRAEHLDVRCDGVEVDRRDEHDGSSVAVPPHGPPRIGGSAVG
jgi:hypothetical protein